MATDQTLGSPTETKEWLRNSHYSRVCGDRLESAGREGGSWRKTGALTDQVTFHALRDMSEGKQLSRILKHEHERVFKKGSHCWMWKQDSGVTAQGPGELAFHFQHPHLVTRRCLAAQGREGGCPLASTGTCILILCACVKGMLGVCEGQKTYFWSRISPSPFLCRVPSCYLLHWASRPSGFQGIHLAKEYD